MKKIIIIVSITALISLGVFFTGRLMADKNFNVSKVSESKDGSGSKINSSACPSPVITEPASTPIATPVEDAKNKIIVIDPGHANRSNLETEQNAPGSSGMKIKDGGGTQGIVTKTPEYLINMNISLKLRDLLRKKVIQLL
jgi:N-acetylmuramoyl-L-alanine amidase